MKESNGDFYKELTNKCLTYTKKISKLIDPALLDASKIISSMIPNSLKKKPTCYLSKNKSIKNLKKMSTMKINAWAEILRIFLINLFLKIGCSWKV